MMRLWGCYWQPFHNSNHLCKLCKEYIHDEINLSKLNKVIFQIHCTFVKDLRINGIGILCILTSHLYTLNIWELLAEEL